MPCTPDGRPTNSGSGDGYSAELGRGQEEEPPGQLELQPEDLQRRQAAAPGLEEQEDAGG